MTTGLHGSTATTLTFTAFQTGGVVSFVTGWMPDATGSNWKPRREQMQTLLAARILYKAAGEVCSACECNLSGRSAKAKLRHLGQHSRERIRETW